MRCIAVRVVFIVSGLASASPLAQAEPVATACASPSQAEADVRAVIGGMFAVDHIGPLAYQAVEARVRAEPACHLATLVRLATGFDASLLSSKYPNALLQRVASDAPAEVRQVARMLVAIHERALAVPPADAYQRFRLERSIRALEPFLR